MQVSRPVRPAQKHHRGVRPGRPITVHREKFQTDPNTEKSLNISLNFRDPPIQRETEDFFLQNALIFTQVAT